MFDTEDDRFDFFRIELPSLLPVISEPDKSSILYTRGEIHLLEILTLLHDFLLNLCFYSYSPLDVTVCRDFSLITFILEPFFIFGSMTS